MKYLKSFLATALVFVAVIVASSCRELAQNGDFSGQWQVLTIEYPDGTTENVQGKRYYRVYRDVLQLAAPGGTVVTANLVYDEAAAVFSAQFPYTTPADVASWGIGCPDGTDPSAKGFTARFSINKLSASQLVFTGETGIVVTCRKF